MPKKLVKNNPVTKKDLSKLSSKTDFKNLRSEILKVEGRVENLEDGQKRIEAKIDNLTNTLDGFVGRVDNLTKENRVGADQYREHDLKIEDHEARITTLEPPTQ